jgi:hypothetical protein
MANVGSPLRFGDISADISKLPRPFQGVAVSAVAGLDEFQHCKVSFPGLEI